jgi:osmotically inducible protein OsmC
MKTEYTGVATAHGGRAGHVRSSDGILDFDLKRPKEMGGPGGGTNPEQLFAAGYSACFESAFRSIGAKQMKHLRDVEMTAHVSFNTDDSGGHFLSVEMRGKADGLSKEETMELMNAAHQICPYSKATRGNIEVKLFAD